MNKGVLLVVVIAAAIGGYYAVTHASGGMDLTVSEKAVVLHCKDLDATFSRGDRVSQTYMIFGGGYNTQPNMLSRLTIAGLKLEHAQRIYKRYPDFHKCSSRGASLAKSRIRQVDMIPADSGVAARFKKAFDAHNASLQGSGQRACIRVEGVKLKLESVVVREVGEDVTRHYKNLEYYLISSAETVDGKTALEAE